MESWSSVEILSGAPLPCLRLLPLRLFERLVYPSVHPSDCSSVYLCLSVCLSVICTETLWWNKLDFLNYGPKLFVLHRQGKVQNRQMTGNK